MGNDVRIRSSFDDKVSSGLDRIRDKFDQLGGKGSAASLFGNIGAKAVAKGFDLIGSAADAVVNILGDAVKAAREDQASIVALDAALKANIEGWNGNTSAIEATISARMRLGFADEEQRHALELLVGATHDVNKALDIESIAMDLAARKHISLEEASTALIKVEGGQYRALKALGIVLPANATAEEALAAAHKVTAGAAEAEANTDEGKLKAAQIRLSERLEKLGYTIMPLVTDAMLAIADAAEPIVQGLVDVVNAAKDADAWLTNLTGSTHAAGEETDLLGSKTDPLGKALHGLADDLSGVTIKSRIMERAMGDARGGVDSDARGMAAAIESVGTATITSSGQVARGVDKIVSSWDAARSAINSTAQGFANAMFDPLIAKDELAATRKEIADQRRIVSSKKSSQAEIDDANARLHVLEKTEVLQVANLATYAKGMSETQLRAQIDILTATKHLSSEQIAALNALEKELAQVQRAAKLAADAISRATPEAGHVTAGSGRAAGGPLAPYASAFVGEGGDHRETVVAGSGGAYVISQANGGGGGGGGDGAPVIIELRLDGRVVARAVDEHLFYDYRRAAPTTGRV